MFCRTIYTRRGSIAIVFVSRIFRLSIFKYSDVVSHGFSNLGHDNVSVFAYAAIKNSLESAFIEKFGIRHSNDASANEVVIANRSYNNFRILMVRITNRFCALDPKCDQSIFTSERLYRIFLKFYSGLSYKLGSPLLDKKAIQAVNNFDAGDNAFTADLLGIDLESHGYSITTSGSGRR